MGWLYLSAGLCEIAYAGSMPRTVRFTKLWPGVFYGMVALSQDRTVLRILGFVLILAGIVGLKLLDGRSAVAGSAI